MLAVTIESIIYSWVCVAQEGNSMSASGAQGHAIRPPAVAGTFYPREPEALRAMLSRVFLSSLGPGEIPAIGAGNPDDLWHGFG